ncbi:unnamed protein product, partial [Rotaria magnacalcarata]
MSLKIVIVLTSAAVCIVIAFFTVHKSNGLYYPTDRQPSKSRPFFGIWCGKACWDSYISDEFYHIWKELEEVYGWIEVADISSSNRTWLTNDNVTSYFNRHFRRIPDLILYISAFTTIKRHAAFTDWKLIRHSWVFMDDVHAWDSHTLKSNKLALMAVDNIVSTYPYRIDAEYSIEN